MGGERWVGRRERVQRGVRKRWRRARIPQGEIGGMRWRKPKRGQVRGEVGRGKGLASERTGGGNSDWRRGSPYGEKSANSVTKGQRVGRTSEGGMHEGVEAEGYAAERAWGEGGAMKGSRETAEGGDDSWVGGVGHTQRNEGRR